MVIKCIVHMHVTAELKVYWLLLSSAVADLTEIAPVNVCVNH